MIKYLDVISPRNAASSVAAVYRQIERDFGHIADPFVAHSEVPELLSGFWSITRETLLAGSEPRALKEAIAAIVSRGNGCQYCIDAHSVMLSGLGRGDVARAIGATRERELSEPATRDVLLWAAAALSPEAPIITRPPFIVSERPELIGTVVQFQYINRIAVILLDDSPLPPPVRRGLFRRFGLALGGWRFAPAMARPKRPRDSLLLLPEAPLPADLAWAAASPHVSGAFARFAAAVEQAAAPVVDAQSRAVVTAQLARWRGAPMPLSRSWVEAPIAALPAKVKPVARLALLASLSPHQIDAAVVDAARVACPQPGGVLAVIAWASFAAARRVGTWIWKASPRAPASSRGLPLDRQDYDRNMTSVIR